MRRIFADTYYWIALINDRDQGLTLQNDTLVTTLAPRRPNSRR